MEEGDSCFSLTEEAVEKKTGFHLITLHPYTTRPSPHPLASSHRHWSTVVQWFAVFTLFSSIPSSLSVSLSTFACSNVKT